jgi:hypothetical protein
MSNVLVAMRRSELKVPKINVLCTNLGRGVPIESKCGQRRHRSKVTVGRPKKYEYDSAAVPYPSARRVSPTLTSFSLLVILYFRNRPRI